ITESPNSDLIMLRALDVRPLVDFGVRWARMYHRFAYDRDAFMAAYHKRSNVESTFSMIKSEFGDSVMSKSPVGQQNKILAKVLAHNVVVVGQAVHEFGIAPQFAASIAG